MTPRRPAVERSDHVLSGAVRSCAPDTARERALDSLPPALYQGPSAREEVKPVVTRLVVTGAAVGSLVLLAGAVMLVVRLAQPTEYPVDLSRPSDREIVGPGRQIRVAYDPYEGKS